MSVNDDGLPTEGSTVAGKYVIGGVLGRGGMGVVLEARHVRLGRPVALKILVPHLRKQADVMERFEREARNASRLSGPNATRVLDVDVLPDGSPFMVMELLQGTELGQEVTRRGPLPVEEAVGYVLEACSAMAEAHAIGIIHRDLKPSNLFLAEHGARRIVKVLDFGISKWMGDAAAALTQTQTAFGTPNYMSPEQVRSVRTVDGRTDIWSLGVILYEILTAKPPFDGPTPTAILAAIIADAPRAITHHRPDLPAPLAAAVMRALTKDPAGRFADVRSFAAAIAPYGPREVQAGWAAFAEAPGAARATHAPGDPHDAPTIAITAMSTSRRLRASTRRAVALIVGMGLLAGVAVALAALSLAKPEQPAEATQVAAQPSAAPPVQAASAAVADAAPAPSPESPRPVEAGTPAPARSVAPVRTAKPSSAPTQAPTATPTADPKYL